MVTLPIGGQVSWAAQGQPGMEGGGGQAGYVCAAPSLAYEIRDGAHGG